MTKMRSLRVYKSGKQVLDKYNGGSRVVEPFLTKKGIFERVFECTEIIYVFKESKVRK